jgi:hypothetical protein
MEAEPASDDVARGPWDEVARDLFPYRDISPEEYAARHAHQVGCFSLDRHHYNDPELASWFGRLGTIFRDLDELERCRRTFLTTAEYAAIRQEIEDTMRDGL